MARNGVGDHPVPSDPAEFLLFFVAAGRIGLEVLHTAFPSNRGNLSLNLVFNRQT